MGTCGSEVFAVWGEGGGELGIGGGWQFFDDFGAGEVDDEECAGASWGAACDGEGFAVGVEGDGEDAFGHVGDAAGEGAVFGVPESDFVVAADGEGLLVVEPGDGGDGERLGVFR